MWGQFGVPMARQLPSSCINCPRPPRGASGCDPALSQRACQLSADVGGLKAVAQAPAGPRMWRPGAGRMGRGRGKVAVGRAAQRLPDSIWRTVFGEGEQGCRRRGWPSRPRVPDSLLGRSPGRPPALAGDGCT